MPLDSQTVQDFAVALGLATLSGYSLYATAFLTGLAVRLGWLPDLTHDHLLNALGETPSLVFFGCVAVVEFLTGKVRFLGSAWDLLHTLIRPVGAAILAVHAWQHHGQASELLVALLGGTAAFGMHGLKTAGNLTASHVPVPFANAVVSGTGSLMYLAGFILLLAHAVLAVCVFGALALLGLWLMPKAWQRLRPVVRFLWDKGASSRQHGALGR